MFLGGEVKVPWFSSSVIFTTHGDFQLPFSKSKRFCVQRWLADAQESC